VLFIIVTACYLKRQFVRGAYLRITYSYYRVRVKDDS